MNKHLDLDFFHLLSGSYTRLTKQTLVPADLDASTAAAWLYEDAPFGVLAHNTDADPRFIYANITAQKLFEYDWDEFVTIRSRFSAEAPNREERQRLLDAAARDGYMTDYRGLRIAKSGRRFWVENVTLWQLTDENGTLRGQAARLPDWHNA
jgi:PAS domain-containing protein